MTVMALRLTNPIEHQDGYLESILQDASVRLRQMACLGVRRRWEGGVFFPYGTRWIGGLVVGTEPRTSQRSEVLLPRRPSQIREQAGWAGRGRKIFSVAYQLTGVIITSVETKDVQKFHGYKKAGYMCGMSVVQCTDRYASAGSALRHRKGSTSKNTRPIGYTIAQKNPRPKISGPRPT
jgi:hypothetical protein